MNIKIDNFNEINFKSYVDNIFIKLLHAVMLNKLDTVDHFISDGVYYMLNEKIKELDEKNLIQMYEMTNVRESSITNFEETDDKYIITVTLHSRYVDYLIDKNTKQTVSGDDEHRVEKTNILKFERSKDIKKQSIARKCPTCGANMDINNNGKCKYCGSIYDLENYNFILVSWITE